jgi:hypothetical protein
LIIYIFKPKQTKTLENQDIRKKYEDFKSSGSKMSLVDLKALLKSCNLKTSGEKDELVKRLSAVIFNKLIKLFFHRFE